MHQKHMGHPWLTVDAAGLFINLENFWLAASPDSLVHDPTNASHPQGIVEIKNPYWMQDKIVEWTTPTITVISFWSSSTWACLP